MRINKADLHIHSHYSDGDCSIEELVERIKKSELKAAVLADHDTTDGAERFINLCAQYGIDTIPGIEVSSIYYYLTGTRHLWKTELHILGYGYDLKSLSKNNELLYYNQVIRNHHVEEMITKYRKNNDFLISFIELTKKFNIPWPLTAKYWLTKARVMNLMETKNMGFLEAKAQAGKEISSDGPFHVERGNYCSAQEAIKLIIDNGGLAVWAHPMICLHQLEESIFSASAKDIFERILKELKNSGLCGLEVYTEHHSQKDQKFLLEYCQKYDLNPNFGGSDYHGDKEDEHMPGIYLGKGGIGYNQFSELKKILKKK